MKKGLFCIVNLIILLPILVIKYLILIHRYPRPAECRARHVGGQTERLAHDFLPIPHLDCVVSVSDPRKVEAAGVFPCQATYCFFMQLSFTIQ